MKFNKKIKKFIIFFILLSLSQPLFSAEESLIQKEVNDLNKEIRDKKNQIQKIQKIQKSYSNKIEQTQKEKANLSNQIKILDNRLAKSELDIEKTEIRIDQTKLEKNKINLEIEEKNKEIKNIKEKITSILNLIHKQDQTGFLEIMLVNSSLSDFLNEVKYLEDINKGVEESLVKIEKKKRELERAKKKLEDKNQELVELKKIFIDKKSDIELEKRNKGYIIKQVKNSEEEYQKLLQEAKKEQNIASIEISSLEKTVREKIKGLAGKKLKLNTKGLIWPIPQNTITARFHDPEYPFRHIFEHPAIDIRASQGTILKAAASGYVARAKDAGYGYSYIMIIHGNGLSTVYGHVSQINVKEDEYVNQGQVIGKSGGMPGTRGAGRLTTGPHLHFEVRLNGIPVNPLSYLP